METSNDCFVAALQQKMKEQGRGAKKKLAANVGISPNHLSDILAKRKNAGQKLKERIAENVGLSFEEMLVLGRHIIEAQGAGNFYGTDGETQGHGVTGDAQLQNRVKSVDYMAMSAKILESNTPYRQALISNITQYYQELETSWREKKALQMIEALQEEMNIMREELNALRKTESGGEDATDTAAA